MLDLHFHSTLALGQWTRINAVVGGEAVPGTSAQCKKQCWVPQSLSRPAVSTPAQAGHMTALQSCSVEYGINHDVRRYMTCTCSLAYPMLIIFWDNYTIVTSD